MLNDIHAFVYKKKQLMCKIQSLNANRQRKKENI